MSRGLIGFPTFIMRVDYPVPNMAIGEAEQQRWMCAGPWGHLRKRMLLVQPCRSYLVWREGSEGYRARYPTGPHADADS